MMMLKLGGYIETDRIYAGGRTIVYRALRATDGQPVIIKVLRNQNPNFNELVQFHNQYVITRNLEHPAIVKPLGLERYGNGYGLVMPDDGAHALGDYWEQSERNLTEFLTIAIRLADALHYLTGQRIIHKDIKPSNILIHPETGLVKLIDFSISSLLPKEQQQLMNPKVMEGTLAYISPEQTGRMNRGIDYRTDFYSLGVTFFELLTGKLPFSIRDPMELVHCHIAQEVQFPAESEVPEVVQAIVLKLMAKNAEDRYQSALGLKHDLEQCLQQLSATGEITLFELGERDMCDRFLIPEKLYGREIEVQTLLNAFEGVAAGNTEMMLVAGFSGIGKTAVINEVHKPIVKQRGYFIKGKFDQFNRNIPFSAFLQAFRDLMGQLLGESDAELANWKANILEAVGENGQVIIEVIPESERIIGQQPPVPELSGTAAQNRFNFLFGKFVRVFATKDHPLVIFLDDLQWADAASLNLLKLLMDDSVSGYLLVLGAYRDNEVFPAHPLMLTLSEILKQGANINTLTLGALSEVDITHLVADTLMCSTEIAAPLSQLVYKKTQGNPFFTTQFLKGLYSDGCITFDADALYWQCDLARVRQLALTDDVVTFMVEQLRKLPTATQSVLKLAACIGNRFDLATLAVVCEGNQEEVATSLWRGLQEGFVIPESETYKFFQGDERDRQGVESIVVGYRFLHDRVQQAAYSLIPDSEKAHLHYTIGELLLESAIDSGLEEKLFDILNHMNMGLNYVVEKSQIYNVCRLNLMAGMRAKASTAYQAGGSYLSAGIGLLPPDSWEFEYDLTFSLYKESVECHYLAGDFTKAEALVETTLEHAASILDKAKVNAIRLVQYQNSAAYGRAIKVGLESLNMLGMELPESPDKQRIELAALEVEKNIGNRDIESLALLPQMQSSKQQMVVLLLINLIPPTYIANQSLMILVILSMTRICLRHGNTPLSGFVYLWYGTVLCSLFGEYDKGDKFGALGLTLDERADVKALRGKIYMTFGSFISHWKRPLQEGLEWIKRSFHPTIEAGELSWCFHGGLFNFWKKFMLYDKLEVLAEEQEKLFEFSRKVEVPAALALATQRQVIVNLRGLTSESLGLSDETFDEASAMKICKERHYFYGNSTYYFAKAFIHFSYGYYSEAYQFGLEAEKTHDSLYSQFQSVLHDFYQALSLTHIFHSEAGAEKCHDGLEKLRAYASKFESLANSCPENYKIFSLLVGAEVSRIERDFGGALEYYDRAISEAMERRYFFLEALAKELAAKFYLDWGKEKVAAAYMEEAYYCYARWGATAKTNQLEAKYPQLLTEILQKKQVKYNPLDHLESLTQTLTSVVQGHTQSGTQLSEALDFAAILQAAQTLSGTIELDQLLGDIVQIILTNAGAQKTVLLIQQADQWQLRAIAELTRDGTVETSTKSQPLTSESPVPIRLVQYVKNTEEAVLINKAKTEIAGIIEGYLLKYQPQSVFCVPLLNRGNLVAIVYLEHPTTKGVFTRNRQTIIEFLCAQAAIALQNAQLYQQAQQSLRDLQQAQLQLVQSEKMSALGNLVAGVAHEINNPTSFLQGNIKPALNYVRDLLCLIELYEQKQRYPDEEIKAKIETIDLEFIREDLPNLLGSMNLGVERIRNISNSLRTFSRKDREHKTAFNIHDGIDSTLLILKHRTKANKQRPAIKILKEYADIPEVQCFPGQLNQVFMNILANAIDAFDEANKGKTYAEIKANQNTINIHSSMVNRRVIIQIEDNGCGMKLETKELIFEHGFTTKAVGKGTGLGMAIAHQIVTEKHGGTITCDSTLGQGTTFTIALPIG